jgi:hypothetical protein
MATVLWILSVILGRVEDQEGEWRGVMENGWREGMSEISRWLSSFLARACELCSELTKPWPEQCR